MSSYTNVATPQTTLEFIEIKQLLAWTENEFQRAREFAYAAENEKNTKMAEMAAQYEELRRKADEAVAEKTRELESAKDKGERLMRIAAEYQSKAETTETLLESKRGLKRSAEDGKVQELEQRFEEARRIIGDKEITIQKLQKKLSEISTKMEEERRVSEKLNGALSARVEEERRNFEMRAALADSQLKEAKEQALAATEYSLQLERLKESVEYEKEANVELCRANEALELENADLISRLEEMAQKLAVSEEHSRLEKQQLHIPAETEDLQAIQDLQGELEKSEETIRNIIEEKAKLNEIVINLSGKLMDLEKELKKQPRINDEELQKMKMEIEQNYDLIEEKVNIKQGQETLDNHIATAPVAPVLGSTSTYVKVKKEYNAKSGEKCKYCKFQAYGKTYMDEHMRTKHPELPQSS